MDLAPADIREVATRRVLAKKTEAQQMLRDLYRRSQGVLSSACRLERTARRSDVSEADFVQFYPHYLTISSYQSTSCLVSDYSREHLNTWAAAIEP